MVSMRYSYDNSGANPRNELPARRVRWGQRSSDEMGDLWLQVLTKSEADRHALTEAFRPKMIAEDIVGQLVTTRDNGSGSFVGSCTKPVVAAVQGWAVGGGMVIRRIEVRPPMWSSNRSCNLRKGSR